MEQIIETYKNTIIFYELVICLASLLACTLKPFPIQIEKKRAFLITVRPGWVGFFLSFALLWFVLAFASCGADYWAYTNCFSNSLNPSYWGSKRIESGYVLFNAVIRVFTNNFEVYHAVWAFVVLLLIYSTIFRYREYIHPGLAVFGYANLFYIQSMDLMRISLAAALMFWGYRFIEKNSYWKYGIVILLAMTIHTSAIISFLPLMIVVFIRQRGYLFLKSLVLGLFLVVVYVLRNSIFGSLFGYQYLANNQVRFGSAAFVYYVPLILLLIYIYRKKLFFSDEDVSRGNLLFIFTMSGFVINLMSYIVTAAGRLSCYFMIPYMILPSYFLYLLKQKHSKYLHKIIFVVCIIAFIAFRGYMLFEYLQTDATAPYTNIFGLIIE